MMWSRLISVFDRRGLNLLPHAISIVAFILVASGDIRHIKPWVVILLIIIVAVMSDALGKIPDDDLHEQYKDGWQKTVYYALVFLLDIAIAMTVYIAIEFSTQGIVTALLVLAVIWILSGGLYAYLYRTQQKS